uniref:Enoyl-CoA delta isomerase 2, mitochondrial (inferred by orthology to a human protein) n=1 Tax=Strongyloides venezuelensis TaxID=75913 RepID=A0A0K0FCX6_STRVS
MALKKPLLRLGFTYSKKFSITYPRSISSGDKIYTGPIKNPLYLQNWIDDYCKLQVYHNINDINNYELLRSQLKEIDDDEFDFGVDLPNMKIERMSKAVVIKIDDSDNKNTSIIDMYEGLTEALNYSLEDRTSSITVITGKGQFFSNNNIINMKNDGDVDKFIPIYEKFLHSLIDHDKPLIGLIKGPTIGIMAELLPLFDYVLASNDAYFKTLAFENGFMPGGCSTFTFPAFIGTQTSFNFLWKGQSITAMKAKSLGLVNAVVHNYYFEQIAKKKIRQFSKLDPTSLIVSKKIFRDNIREDLYKCLDVEKTSKRLLKTNNKL